ncbi:MAG: hypothetical protein ACXVEF_34395 [Polyangiales bacterium]
MFDLAHTCIDCLTVTIFDASAPYPRRCGKCDAVVRGEPLSQREEEELEIDFVLELERDAMDVAPF